MWWFQRTNQPTATQWKFSLFFRHILNCWFHGIARTTISLSASAYSFSNFRTKEIPVYVYINILNAPIECITKAFHTFCAAFLWFNISFTFSCGIDKAISWSNSIIIFKFDTCDAKVFSLSLSLHTLQLSFNFLRVPIALYEHSHISQASQSTESWRCSTCQSSWVQRMALINECLHSQLHTSYCVAVCGSAEHSLQTIAFEKRIYGAFTLFMLFRKSMHQDVVAVVYFGCQSALHQEN